MPPLTLGETPKDMETEVKNPDFVREFEADDKGRIYLGTEYAGEKVKVAASIVDKESKEA